MIWAILITVFSVLAGTFLALVPKGRDAWMGPVRTFALMAALSVVVLHLLPEALGEVGIGAILVFILGLIAPELLGKLGVFLWTAGRDVPADKSPTRHRDLALEASYFGLLLHRVGDGIGLGAFTGELHVNAGSGGVVTALAAHAVPVVAIVVLTFDSVRGRGSAIGRAAGLGIASIFGVLLTQTVAAETVATASAWIAAFVGGMLLHVVTHDLGVQLPRTPKERVIDLFAAALGIFVSFVGRDAHHGHEAEAAHVVRHFEDALADFAIETGPLLILGLAVGAFMTTWGARIPSRFFRSRGAVIDAARGTLIGAPLPLCSCSVLPISAALKKRGAAPALVVGFLLATPELGIETFALSVRFLGWELAWVRLFAALFVAFGAALAIAYATKKNSSTLVEPGDLTPEAQPGSWGPRALASFDELFHHIGAWMILGIVGAALLEVALPPEAFSGVKGWFAQFLAITLVAVPSYVCAPSATPLAAVLLAKGLSPGAVLVGLLLGPATNIATVVFLRRWFGARAAALGLLVVVLLSWGVGLLMDFVWRPELKSLVSEHGHEHSALWNVFAVLAGLLLVRAIAKSGVRGFLSTLQGDHGHSHGDGGHSHGGHSHGEGSDGRGNES